MARPSPRWVLHSPTLSPLAQHVLHSPVPGPGLPGVILTVIWSGVTNDVMMTSISYSNHKHPMRFLGSPVVGYRSIIMGKGHINKGGTLLQVQQTIHLSTPELSYIFTVLYSLSGACSITSKSGKTGMSSMDSFPTSSLTLVVRAAVRPTTLVTLNVIPACREGVGLSKK